MRTKTTRIKIAGATVVAALALGATACNAGGLTSSASDCPAAVDALSANITTVTNAADISASVANDSLSKCGGPATWKLSAGVDQIGPRIGSLGDMNDPSMTTSTALDFLCARYGSHSATCTLR